ncbi:gamma-aminobutyric acid receptor subunit beta-1-like [Porites lutea]|uniref:gamma-aminobutyric acid receptor subunit beta-1-like n=1 Tax=Porites lutea TaxID=51062 RepID=UPI003CC606B4
MKHLSRYGVLTDCQHGFRAKRSTETQLICTIHDIASAIQSNKTIHAAILDFSKAFDKVPHRRLLKKLDYYGIRGPLHNWFESFLTQRTQSVVIEGVSSAPVVTTSGVPQGTVLGPLLFLMYINDLPDSLNSTGRLFADDALLYGTICCDEDTADLQEDLYRLEDWQQKWKMEFNPSKCKIMCFTTKRDPPKREYVFCGQILEEVESHPYLGVVLDNKMRWSPHIETITSRANKVLGLIKRNLWNCPKSVKETVYMTLVRPNLQYACSAWDPHYQKDKAALERVQRKAARFVTGNYDRTTSVTEMLQDLQSLHSDSRDWEKSQQEAANLSATINEILNSYDSKLRPNAGGVPVEVKVEIKVVSFGELNEANMEYSMDLFFRQWWYDPRFKHNSSTPFTMAADPTEMFWTPDTYFFNVKKIKYHFVTRENMRVMIYSTGKIYFSARITLTAQCDMDFHLYPMDTQHCSLVIESYAHTTEDIDYRWRRTKANKGKGIEIVSQEMAQFELTGIETKIKDTENSKGSFARLSVVFSFKRRLDYFVSSVFSPTVTLVILSWCCFWINRHAVPARVSLGITTILTSIVLSGTMNQEMPQVSYIKAQDYFLLVSFGFIFVSFLEYMIVLNSDPRPVWFGWLRSCCVKESGKDEKRPLQFEDGVPEKETSYSTEPDMELEEETNHTTEHDMIHGRTHVRNGTIPRRIVVSNTEQGATVLLLDKYGQMRNGGKTHIKSTAKQELCKKPIRACTHWIDMVSRIIFPASYAAFLLVFWQKFVQEGNMKAINSTD